MGVYLGSPWYWGSYDPWYYGYSSAYGYPYSSAPGYAGQDAATTYVEPGPADAPAPAASAPAAPPTFWFYCTEPAGYYPYVQNCRKTWIPVDPKSVRPAS